MTVGGALLLELLLKLLLAVGAGLPLIDADLNAVQAQPLLLQGFLQLRQGAFEDALDLAALGQQTDLDAILLLNQLQVHLAQFRRLQVHGQSLAALERTQGKTLNDLIQDFLFGYERGSGRWGRYGFTGWNRTVGLAEAGRQRPGHIPPGRGGGNGTRRFAEFLLHGS